MVCSVYAAQYLLQGLFENGQDRAALALMTAPGDRSWRHMVESGTTITWEAWDQHYKPNQDWNHAWGAAPVNLLPAYILGVSPRVPGWSEVEIRPAVGLLAWCEGRVPTPRGPVEVRWEQKPFFRLRMSLPTGMTAHVTIPAGDSTGRVSVDGRAVTAHRDGDRWSIEQTISGTAVIEAH
jgi:alpha-L-rhamnosidase